MSDDDEAEAGGSSLLHKSLDNATANNDDPSERQLEDLVARIAENTRNGRVNWKSVLATLHKSELPGDQSYWMRWSCDKLKEWCRKPRKPRKRDRKHRKRDRKHRKREAAATAPVLGVRKRFRQLFKDNANKPAQMRSFEEVALREAQNANDGTNLTEPEAEAARRIAS